MNHIIECISVTRAYGKTTAVDNVSFTVEQGEVFGVVGPNGAGKTTLIEMLEGLRFPDSGSLRVMGIDPSAGSAMLKERIGVQLQSTSVQPGIRVREAIRLFSSFYPWPVRDPDELLEELFLNHRQDSSFEKLSGGEKQRVAIALALVNDPEVIFLDELSTGLDPASRRRMWELVGKMKDRGQTVVMTTHYMEEAEALCDRVAVLDHGRIIALDTPRSLISQLEAGSRVSFRAPGVGMDGGWPEAEALPGVIRATRSGDEYLLLTADASTTVQELVRAADRSGYALEGIRMDVSSMDDVFLALTGRQLRQ